MLCGLVSLNLRMNTLGDRGLAALVAAVMDHTALRAMDLRENGFTSAAAESLAALLGSNNVLKMIWVCRNDWLDDGAIAIGHALEENASLTSFSLSSSKIGNVGAQGLLNALKVCTKLKSAQPKDRFFTLVDR